MKSQWWFAPSSFAESPYQKLRSTTEAGGENVGFAEAQKLRITVVATYVREILDPFTGNDLVVFSRFRIGQRPTVAKLHLIKPDQRSGTLEEVNFHPEIFATNDYRKEELPELALEILVYDEDGLPKDVVNELVNLGQGTAQALAAAFPALAPYAAFASGAGSALFNLANTLNEHDRLVRGDILLTPNKPSHSGYNLLQPGYLVCFRQDTEAQNLHLGQDNYLYYKDGDAYRRWTHTSYVIIRVTRDGPSSPDMEVTQRMATLMTQMELGKQGKASDSLGFLKTTLDSYSTLKKLKRYKELKAKQDAGAALGQEEIDLMAELSGDDAVSPFIG